MNRRYQKPGHKPEETSSKDESKTNNNGKRGRFSNRSRGRGGGGNLHRSGSETVLFDSKSSKRSSITGSTASLADIDTNRRGDSKRGNQHSRGRGRGRGQQQNNQNFRKNSLSGSKQSLVAGNSTDEQTRSDNSRGRGRGRGRNQNGSAETREIRPIGFKRLQEILKREPNDIILCLTEPRSGLKELLPTPLINIELLSLLLKVIARAFSTELHPTNQNFIMGILMASDLFKLHVPQLLFNRKLTDPTMVLSDLSTIFEAILSKMPDTSAECLESCVMQCTMLAASKGGDKVLKRLEKVKMKIEILQENKEQLLREKRKVKMVAEYYDDEPPEDFREIAITPRIEEIRFMGRPFLRKNVIEGRFKDVDHYLDVHFRLLREDFIAPLRIGINDYLHRDKNSATKKIRDIRLYENVVVGEPHYNKDGVLYSIQFDLKKFRNVKWDMSRRLIFGSLVCLSSDNFETAIFGAVADRNIDELKQGKIKIKFEDEFQQKRELKKSEQATNYIMAESQAYFEAYRHVLKGLQQFNSDNMPLQQYIVHVQQHLEPPNYLDYGTVYDFNGVLPSNEQRDEDINLVGWLRGQRNEDENFPNFEGLADRVDHVKQIQRSVVDIRQWPSAEELDLDNSQRKAMHVALSSAMAIIQGPPGTGKTYVGLKIMKMLLTNRHAWRTRDDSSPILVVCLTNHALDQFLEGMLSFTKRLVRVGSRSKNESLAKYNLRHIQDQMRFDRRRPDNIHYNLEHLHHELGSVRGKMDSQELCIKRLQELILHEDSLDDLTGDDARLCDSMSFGFEVRFEVHPFDKPWCPASFMAVWLGLTSYIDFVPEYEIEEFYHQDTTEFRVPGQYQNLPPQFAVPELPVLIDDFDENDNDDLIDVDDQWTAINRNRQMENDEKEEVKPLEIPAVSSQFWSVEINRLNDPKYLSGGMEMDEQMTILFKQMGMLRQAIAKREVFNREIMGDDEIAGIQNVWYLPLIDRWRLYRRWIEKFRLAGEEKMKNLQEQYEITAKQYQEVRNAEELGVLRNNDVIGMTTTGAAKYLSTLQELGPKIVIVEEAAEVLESHIITSISHNTQHLILIGDHQQLRPTVNVYQLAEKYHLDVSLFERLIKNDVRYETLQLQHRMRPEISRLLVPNIYKNLEDHPSVRRYRPIKGVESSIFFLNHNHPEEVVTDSTTRSNPFEAEFLVGLCRYLLQQGYEQHQITILTAYAGQLCVFRRIMPRDVFEGVKVTVVDNFQGEENDIILLSFVRSNDDGKIGFLKIDNRVNVALSRAKQGLFCVGNFKFLASRSNLWRAIVSDLEREDQIGDAMPLVCQKHKNKSMVNCKNDFQRLTPEGGCLQQCGEDLPCGHFCKRICHATAHTSCEQVCGKVICELLHTCPMKCYLPCEPCRVPVRKDHLYCDHKLTVPCSIDIATVLCRVKVDRVLPICGHAIKLECHVKVEEYLCQVSVERELPHCKHLTEMACHKNPENVECKIPCDVRLDECGHVCPRTCHPLDDVDHEHIQCRKKCPKEICERGHKCKKLCCQPCSTCLILVDKELPCGHIIKHPCSRPIVLASQTSVLLSRNTTENEFVKPCTEPCKRFLSCGHKCQQKCSSPCGECKEVVDKILPCGHTATTVCSANLHEIFCHKPCTKMLQCGHRCLKPCGEICSEKCKHPISRPGSCGHEVRAPCHLHDASPQKVSKHCNHPCGKLLQCEHTCQGTCGECRQGRVHIPCTQKCERPQICGHPCTFPCALLCPPCNRKCTTQCNHSRCNRRCGQTCQQCREDCHWRCTHLACTLQCGDFCNRGRCNIPCRRTLPCGHQCIGLCGDICPKLCRVCNNKELTEFVIYGNEDEPDARFIQLKDCGHCIEVEALDHWMDMEDEEIKMKGCPRCSTTIWKSYRYGNAIKKRVLDIQKVKTKIFGDIKFLRRDMDKVYRSIYTDGILKEHFPGDVGRLEKLLSGRNALHQNQMAVVENQVKILKLMSTMKEKSSKQIKSKRANDYIANEIKNLSSRLMKNKEKMDQWELEAITKELRRVELWTVYMETEDHIKGSYNPDPQRHLADAYYLLASSLTLTTEEEKKVEELMKKAAVLPGLAISEAERIEIVNAIGLIPGHWFKCPKGHVYVISECGGAMQEGTCNECGAKIGGGSHTLRSDNALAPEMDGATRPAYGEHVGLGNFDLRGLQ